MANVHDAIDSLREPAAALFEEVRAALADGAQVKLSGFGNFYLRDERPLYHAVWHLFVLGGTAFHFCAVWLHVVPLAD